MSPTDYLTIDVFEKPSLGAFLWKRSVRDAVARGIDGLRAATVNHANNGTRALIPARFLLVEPLSRPGSRRTRRRTHGPAR